MTRQKNENNNNNNLSFFLFPWSIACIKRERKELKNCEKTLSKHILESRKNQYFKKLRRDLKEEVEQSHMFFLVQFMDRLYMCIKWVTLCMQMVYFELVSS